MKICLSVPWKIKINDHIDRLYIDAPRQQVGTDQITTVALTKVVKYPISMVLSHSRMYVITGIADFSDLFSQQLHTLCRVAKNYGLIDLQLQIGHFMNMWIFGTPYKITLFMQPPYLNATTSMRANIKYVAPCETACSSNELSAFPGHMRSTV